MQDMGQQNPDRAARYRELYQKLYKNPDQSCGLYDPANERDNCGVGFVANIDGRKEHKIVRQGLELLENLIHRGAVGGDLKTGDGAGILTQLPHDFFYKVCKQEKISLPEAGRYGVAMVFLSRERSSGDHGVRLLMEAIKESKVEWLGMREVPTNPDSLGEIALAGMPRVIQVFVSCPGESEAAIERELYLTRKIAENKARAEKMDQNDFYICSFSSRTVIYKGLLVGHQMEQFYPDLADNDFVSALALVHQRYSTNTFPTWPLAQPFRYLAHNGEINTLRGNINKMMTREKTMHSDLFGDDIKKLLPIIDVSGSDSAVFDNVFELLVNTGRSMEHSMMMMVPEAFGSKYHISEDKRAFYEYHANFMEPWDGPAALVFTDGTRIGATLDRNGLRPCRYTLTKDGFMVLASECGVLEIEPERVLRKGRLQPGKMFIIDTEKKRLQDDIEIKSRVSRSQPYRHWLNHNRIELKGLFGAPTAAQSDPQTIMRKQMIFGYSYEDIEQTIVPMAQNGQEPINSMGIDTSLAVMNKEPQPLFNYFKQLFAQVTNPPIDPIREGLVMSLTTFIGNDANLLDESPEHCRKLKLPHPILTNDDLARIRNSNRDDFRAVELSSLFPVKGGDHAMETALEEMFMQAAIEINNGASVLIISDRGADEQHAPIPSLLASAGLHHYLIRKGLRSQAGIILETGEAREVTHFALLSGFGCNAVNPWLALETISNANRSGAIKSTTNQDDAVDRYINAIKKGMLKIFSKMGISTLRSYQSAQIFEAVGLSRELVDKYFTYTASRIGGIGIREIQQETLTRHRRAFNSTYPMEMLPVGGFHRVRVKSGNHLWTPQTIKLLQQAVRENDQKKFSDFSDIINTQEEGPVTLRNHFKFKQTEPVSLDEVEPVEKIFKRFATGAMSYGSLSKEAHEALAVAMNRIGGKSNTGEGGEETERFQPRPDGTSARSAIKQVASGRFGVTTEYLVNADEIQIKMAQGAKPGEGGQLPGHKVDKIIAKVRHSTPGVTLISPPPHHDIYSIEDLAQLIWDLRNVNPAARISVKLVSEVGVGTVAAGVAKAKADMVLISGHDGGTGASPRSSILHAGIPWELGLAETQQTLVRNQLRDKIVVQTDGQIRTGRDVVVAALLGAEEFGFATTPLVTLGCIMMRKCHKNTCPVGVATQDNRLRSRFRGHADHVVNYFHFVAEEVRKLMAQLGFRTMDEMIGRSDLLDFNPGVANWKSRLLDFSDILYRGHIDGTTPLHCTTGQHHELDTILDRELIKQAAPALDEKKQVTFSSPIRNCNRTTGAMLAGEAAKRYGNNGLPDDTINITFRGSAGQSFGAFLTPGINFRLEGEANDYLGKGMSGGSITVVPPENSSFRAENNIIVGNTLLYGATGGEVYIRGMAGERFGVRNSGAVAVVEGVGDHCCEYMTGGIVVVLGQTGRNFAAGMSGGIAYVLDNSQLFDTLCNLDMVNVEPLIEDEDINKLKELIEKHVTRTGSRFAREILDDWREIFPRFVKVMPTDYKRALQAQLLEEYRDTDTVSVTEEVFTQNG